MADINSVTLVGRLTRNGECKYTQNGGAVFLGVKKVVVKGHGASTPVSVKCCIMQAKSLAEKKLVENIEIKLRDFGLAENE